MVELVIPFSLYNDRTGTQEPLRHNYDQPVVSHNARQFTEETTKINKHTKRKKTRKNNFSRHIINFTAVEMRRENK